MSHTAAKLKTRQEITEWRVRFRRNKFETFLSYIVLLSVCYSYINFHASTILDVYWVSADDWVSGHWLCNTVSSSSYLLKLDFTVIKVCRQVGFRLYEGTVKVLFNKLAKTHTNLFIYLFGEHRWRTGLHIDPWFPKLLYRPRCGSLGSCEGLQKSLANSFQIIFIIIILKDKKQYA